VLCKLWQVRRNVIVSLFILLLCVFSGTPIDVCAQKLLPTVLAAERGFFLSDSSGHLLAPYKEQTSEVRDAVWKHTSEVLTRLQ
jgi:hypothetical protein